MKDLVINCSHFTLLCVGKHVFVTIVYVYNKFLWPVCIKIIRCHVHYVLQLLWLPNAIALYNKHINTFYYVIQKYLLCASLMPEKPSKMLTNLIQQTHNLWACAFIGQTQHLLTSKLSIRTINVHISSFRFIFFLFNN